MKETNITYCAVCNSRVERIMHQFPSRKPPHNLPYFAALYHRDPFWKKGDFEEYCGAVCATKAFIMERGQDGNAAPC